MDKILYCGQNLACPQLFLTSIPCNTLKESGNEIWESNGCFSSSTEAYFVSYKKKLFRLIANFTNNIVVVCSSHDSFDNTLVCTLVRLFLFKHF